MDHSIKHTVICHATHLDHALCTDIALYRLVLMFVLNVQKFREPLYLLDKPVQMQDDRTDDERKFPELFRAKLKGIISKPYLTADDVPKCSC